MLTQQDWEWLAVGSEYQTAVAIQQLLEEGKVRKASDGLYALIELMGKSKRLLKGRQERLKSRLDKACGPSTSLIISAFLRRK